MSVTVDGIDDLIEQIEELSSEMQDAAADVVTATGVELRADVVKRYQNGPASGRVYQKYNPRRTHQASAPGEAPMSDTGRGANSVTFRNPTPLSASVGSDLAYASMLEFGTRKIAPRPAWVPAVEAAREKFRKRLEKVISGVMK